MRSEKGIDTKESNNKKPKELATQLESQLTIEEEYTTSTLKLKGSRKKLEEITTIERTKALSRGKKGSYRKLTPKSLVAKLV